MPRHRRHPPPRVLLNNRLVGHLNKASSGAIDFRYGQSWLDWEHALPVSLSLPLREDPYRGEPVVVVVDNLLPDSDALRRRVAEKVGAAGVDAYSLLAAIGHDCVGALQFVADDDDVSGDTTTITGIAARPCRCRRPESTRARAGRGWSRSSRCSRAATARRRIRRAFSRRTAAATDRPPS